MSDRPFCLRWVEGPLEAPIGWCLHRVNPSGTFFGEFTNHAGRFQRSGTGTIPQDEMQQLHGLVEDIKPFKSFAADRPNVLGVLGIGPWSSSDIVFRFYGEDEQTAGGRLFLKLVEILRPHLESAVNATAKPTDRHS